MVSARAHSARYPRKSLNEVFRLLQTVIPVIPRTSELEQNLGNDSETTRVNLDTMRANLDTMRVNLDTMSMSLHNTNRHSDVFLNLYRMPRTLEHMSMNYEMCRGKSEAVKVSSECQIMKTEDMVVNLEGVLRKTDSVEAKKEHIRT